MELSKYKDNTTQSLCPIWNQRHNNGSEQYNTNVAMYYRAPNDVYRAQPVLAWFYNAWIEYYRGQSKKAGNISMQLHILKFRPGRTAQGRGQVLVTEGERNDVTKIWAFLYIHARGNVGQRAVRHDKSLPIQSVDIPPVSRIAPRWTRGHTGSPSSGSPFQRHLVFIGPDLVACRLND